MNTSLGNLDHGSIKLDDIDLAIIKTLKLDGRTPFAQIAQRLFL
jgi:DNA-binding Lrp family transcriptional regulator